MGHVKTTVELPDELLVAAKRQAAEERTTLRALIARGLRLVLDEGPRRTPGPIEWVTTDGGLPPGLDVADRVQLRDWIRTNK